MMARKGIFQPLVGQSGGQEEGDAETSALRSGLSRFPSSGPMRAMRSSLTELQASSIQDIDPSMIDDSKFKDRLGYDPVDIKVLADSIRQHSQQVPIMLRPLDDRPGRYEIIYGRRRLLAIRSLGIMAKAIVRTLDDTRAVLAQGQENSLRLDPSFIERALFAITLRETGYDSKIIQDALGISKQSLSQLTVVAEAIPVEIIEAIGAAHGVGRRRWLEVADLSRHEGVDLTEAFEAAKPAFGTVETSEERFEIFVRTAQEILTSSATPAPPSPVQTASRIKPVHLRLENGKRLARLRRTGGEVVLGLSIKAEPDFTQWFEANAEEVIRGLHDHWVKDQRQG